MDTMINKYDHHQQEWKNFQVLEVDDDDDDDEHGTCSRHVVTL